MISMRTVALRFWLAVLPCAFACGSDADVPGAGGAGGTGGATLVETAGGTGGSSPGTGATGGTSPRGPGSDPRCADGSIETFCQHGRCPQLQDYIASLRQAPPQFVRVEPCADAPPLADAGAVDAGAVDAGAVDAGAVVASGIDVDVVDARFAARYLHAITDDGSESNNYYFDTVTGKVVAAQPSDDSTFCSSGHPLYGQIPAECSSYRSACPYFGPDNHFPLPYRCILTE